MKRICFRFLFSKPAPHFLDNEDKGVTTKYGKLLSLYLDLREKMNFGHILP